MHSYKRLLLYMCKQRECTKGWTDRETGRPWRSRLCLLRPRWWSAADVCGECGTCPQRRVVDVVPLTRRRTDSRTYTHANNDFVKFLACQFSRWNFHDKIFKKLTGVIRQLFYGYACMGTEFTFKWGIFLTYLLHFAAVFFGLKFKYICNLSLIHIWRCRRSYACRSRWSPYH